MATPTKTVFNAFEKPQNHPRMIMEMGEDYPPSHLWHADLASDTAEKMLREYILNAESESPRFTRLERDLTECWACMEVYHKEREKIVSKMPQIGYYDRVGQVCCWGVGLGFFFFGGGGVFVRRENVCRISDSNFGA